MLKDIFGFQKQHPQFGKEQFTDLLAMSPRRACFASRTNSPLRKNTSGGAFAFMNFSFSETFDCLFPWEIRKNRHGRYYRLVKDESEYRDIEEWIDDNSEIVFLRSLATSCFAVSEHQKDGQRTPMGELEYQAKWHKDGNALAELTGEIAVAIRRLLDVEHIDAIVGMPASTPGQNSFPMDIASRLQEHLSIADLSSHLRWKKKKPSLKELSVELKWDTLENIGLTVDGDFNGKSIILLDDLYQSGSTMHFVASKLCESGVSEIHCVSAVKSQSDSDNT